MNYFKTFTLGMHKCQYQKLHDFTEISNDIPRWASVISILVILRNVSDLKKKCKF